MSDQRPETRDQETERAEKAGLRPPASGLLTVQNLSLSFGNQAVLRDVSFQVASGELVALVGESGSGKSLSALSILGLEPQEATASGVIHFHGEELRSLPRPKLRELRGNLIGMVFQEPMSALNPLHTIGRQIIEPYRVHTGASDADAKGRLLELLELVGLSHLKTRLNAYPHHLSGGERQRAMIAMAISCTPRLLICDEPTTALDVTLQRQVLRLIKDLQVRMHMGILLITHDLPVVRKVADRVIVMRHGEIVEEGPTKPLFTAPKHAYTDSLIHALPESTTVPITPDAPPILSAEALKVHFPIKSGFLRRVTGHVKAVDGISLTLRRGETLGIVGESGSGKSSLGFALLRLAPSRGPIVFMGERIDTRRAKDLKSLRKHMQLVFQDPFASLNPRMTVGEIVAEGLRVHGTSDSRGIRASVADMLARVGLSPDMASRYPHEFSGGQRQRVAIARAMILNPSLVVLDEPTSALDMSVQATILDLLQQFQREQGVSYLLISHDLRVIRALSHRVIVMKSGRVVEEADAETLYTRPQSDYTRALLDAAYGESL